MWNHRIRRKRKRTPQNNRGAVCSCQAAQISDYIEGMSNEERETYKLAIRIMKSEIERRKRTLADYSFFEKRALLCYRMAYIKSNMPEHFCLFLEEMCKKDGVQS